MMKMLSRQRGMSLLGMVIVLGVAALLGTCAMRILPAYYDYIIVKEILKDVATEPESGSKSPHELRQMISSQFITNRVETIKPTDVKFKVERGVITMDGSYETRVHMIYNIDAVIVFGDLVFEIPRR